MTDRLNGLIVTFDGPLRTDDAEVLISAISMLKGVADVSPVLADMSRDWTVETRTYNKVRTAIAEALERTKP